MVNRLLPGRISALHLFLTGMLCLPAYLFQDTLWVRAAQVVLFGALARIAGKKIKWIYFLITAASITLFNLFTPIGRVLFHIGPVPITVGALQAGLMKGLTIVGLVFISLFSIRADLRLPGRLGALIGLVFYYYERIFEGRKKIDLRNVIPSIDQVLSGLFEPPVAVERAPDTGAGSSQPESTNAAGQESVEAPADVPTALPADRRVPSPTDGPPVRTTAAGYLFSLGLLTLIWASLFLV